MCGQNTVFTTYMSLEKKFSDHMCAQNWNFYWGEVTVKCWGQQESGTLEGNGTFLGKGPRDIFLFRVTYCTLTRNKNDQLGLLKYLHFLLKNASKMR